MTNTILHNTIDFAQKVSLFLLKNACESAIVLVSEMFANSNTDLHDALQNIDYRIIGGVFPKLIYNNQIEDNAAIIIAIKPAINAKLITLDSSNKKCFDDIKLDYERNYAKTQSLFVFVDAFSKNKNSFIDCLYNFFGSEISYFGGGTGSLSNATMPSIINNQGIHSNAAIIAAVEFDIYTSIKHGWKPLTEPMKISKTDNNKVVSLNWEPAFELYKEICAKHSKMSFDEHSFFDIAKSYPFGKTTIDEEFIIRDPYAVDGNDLLFFDSIVEGEYVCIMHSDKNGLLESAHIAIDTLYRNCDFEIDNIFVIDCISRVLFMQDGFIDELNILSKKHSIFGALSIGEIVSDRNNYLEIFNKSIGLATWKRNS
jgi:hypothetical protein